MNKLPENPADKSLAALDTMTEIWAAKVNLRDIVKTMLGVPEQHREDQVMKLVKQMHSEGLYEGRTSHDTSPVMICWQITLGHLRGLANELRDIADAGGSESYGQELVLQVRPAGTVRDDEGNLNDVPLIGIVEDGADDEGVIAIDPTECGGFFFPSGSASADSIGCDVCSIELHGNDEVMHFSGLLNGKSSGHIHLCHTCAAGLPTVTVTKRVKP